MAAVIVASQNTSAGWWQRETAARGHSGSLESPESSVSRDSSRFAFRALVIFTVVLIAAPQEFVPALLPFRIAFVAALAALVAYGATRLTQGRQSRPVAREVVIVICLVGWAVVTIPWSYWPGGSAAVLTDQYLKAVVVFWLLGEVVSTVGRLRTLMWTLSVLTVPLAFSGLKAYATGAFMEGSDRIAGYSGGLTSNPNDLALVLNIILPLTVSLALASRRWTTRIVALVLIGLSIATIVVTFSRGGFLALALMVGLFLRWLIKRGAWPAVGGLVLVTMLSIVMVPSSYVQRLQTITSTTSDATGSSEQRWRDMAAASAFFLSHPVMGAGLGMDVLALNEVRGASWLHVHNIYLNYAVDLGTPGAVLFIALVAMSIRTATSAERSHDGLPPEWAILAAGVRISLWGFVVGGFFAPVAYNFYFYYLAGLAVSLRTIVWNAQHKGLVAAGQTKPCSS